MQRSFDLSKWGAKVLVSSLVISSFVLIGEQATNLPPRAEAAATLTTGFCSATLGDTTGASLSVVGADCVLELTNTGSTTWTVPDYISQAEVLIIGGGGGGGSSYWAGGGGAGGVVYFPSYTVSPNAQLSLTVGAGGSGGPAPASVAASGVISDGNNGGSSTFDSKTAQGGGGGGGYGWQWGYSTGAGRDGGSGGGTGQYRDSTLYGGASTQGSYAGAQVFGNAGGNDLANSSSGGGGGAGSAGSGPASGSGSSADGGNGGSGKPFTISGTSLYYAAGGGGGTLGTQGGEGGSAIAGDGGDSSSIHGTDGLAGTGSGGGGAGWNNSSGGSGGDGGSGIIIIRYLGASPPVGLIVSETGPFTPGFFTDSGLWVTPTPSVISTISRSAVVDRLQTGNAILRATAGSVTISASISATTTSSLTIKASDAIVVAQDTQIQLAGGDIILWSDSDADSEGLIQLNYRVSFASGGGDIYLAGGLDSDGDEKPNGFASTSLSGEYGISLRTDYSLATSGGNLVIMGKSLPGAYRAVTFEMSGLLDSGAGKISVSGIATATRNYTSGIYVSQDSNNESTPHIWTSANSSPDAISIYGESSGASGANRNGIASVYGSGDASQWGTYISATSIGGGVQIAGVTAASTTTETCGQVSSGVSWDSLSVSAVDGPISIQGSKAFGSSVNEYGLQFDSFRNCTNTTYVGKQTSISTSGNILLSADSIDSRSPISVVAGSLVIEPSSDSFRHPFTLGSGFDVTVSENLRLGKGSNQEDIFVGMPLNLSGILEIYGGAVTASGAIMAPNLAISASGTINLQSANNFERIQVRSGIDEPVQSDILLGNLSDFSTADLVPDFEGVFGVPAHIRFLSTPQTGLEGQAFEITAQVLSDAYLIPISSNNHSTVSVTVSKAQGQGTLTGTVSGIVSSSNVITFSSLVLNGISAASSVSFSLSGTTLVSTESGLIHFDPIPSSDGSLSSLTLGSGSLVPSFSTGTFEYSATLPNATSTITLTPAATNAEHQQIELLYPGGNQIVTSGQASTAIPLSVGLNTIEIVITAEDGSTTTYTLALFRQLAQEIDWTYGSVSITEPDGSVHTASNFVDMYGDNRSSVLADSATLDEDGLPRQTITLKVGEVLYLPLGYNYGNSLGYGGITGDETHICRMLSFQKTASTAAYTFSAAKAGVCEGAFVSTYQRNLMVMLSLGSRAVDIGNGYYRTPYVDIVVERKSQLTAGLFNGNTSSSSSVEWTQPVTLEMKSSETPLPSGAKTYTLVSGPCTVTTTPYIFGGVSYPMLATGQVVASGTGTCVIDATQTQDSYYNAVTERHTITFTQASQQLSFTSNVPPEPLAGGNYTPSASSTALLPVTLGITTGNNSVCTISGGEVSFIATGSCTIQATQAGDSDYQAATPITQTLVVGQANQTITFNSLADRELGDVAFRVQANASSGLAVSFTTNTSNTICTVSSAGLVTIVAEGECSVTANQPGNAEVTAAQSVTRTFTILPEGSSAPFITAVSYGDGSLTGTFISPSYTGGLTILDYSMFAYDASNQFAGIVTGCDAGATPVQCTITGLTNGQSYTLKVAARTSKGLGSLSQPSRAVIPLANPQAVRSLTAVAGNQTLTITWQAPASLGGGDFARFDIRLRPSGGNFPGLSTPSATISAITESSYVFSGLQNGVSYDVEMITITTEPASAMSTATLQSHTAKVIQTPYTRPNAPRNLAAFSVDNSVKIAFAYPDFDGGRQVDEYRVSVNGEVVCTPTQVQVCSVPLSTLTGLLSSNSLGGIGFHQNFGSQLRFMSTTTAIPISVVAVNEGGTSDPAITTYNLVTGSSTPISSGGASQSVAESLPAITSYSKQVLQSTGDAFSITGLRFNLITEIWLADTKLSFIRLSDTSIRISTPTLPIGSHSLQLIGSFGVLSVQSSLSVIEGKAVAEGAAITRTYVDGFTGRSTYLGPENTSKLKSFVLDVAPGSVLKCYGSIPTRAKLADIRLAFKRADRVCDYVQSLNPNIALVRTWVWKDGDEAWDRAQVRLALFQD